MIRILPNLQGHSVHRRLLAATLLAGWIFSTLVHAAEAEPSATSSETDSEANSQPESAATDQTSSTSEVFIPTEDISEDFAVSFPVDI